MIVEGSRSGLNSGASREALEQYERAIHLFQNWRRGALPAAEQAIAVAPDFVMAHVLRIYILICGRESRNLAKARSALAALEAQARTPHERAHLCIVAALSHLQVHEGMKLLDAWILSHPTDVLALQVAHAFDYLLGDTLRLRERIEHVLPNWSEAMPGYEALMSMFAFGLAENLEYTRAAECGLRVLALDPGSPRAHHAMAHVYENAGLHAAGMHWFDAHRSHWDKDDPVSTHLWWHRALLCLHTMDQAQALRIYDDRIAPPAGACAAVTDLVDASSLLWRVFLDRTIPGSRAVTLARHWETHVDDGFCSFNDLHGAMAFAMADRWGAFDALISTLRRRAVDGDAYAMTTREVGLPGCMGIMAFAQGNLERAVRLLSGLPAYAYLIGGSAAQRSVLSLTLRAALARLEAGHSRSTLPTNSHAVA